MNSRIRRCETHTHNLRIPNSQKIPSPKNCELRGFTIIGLSTDASALFSGQTLVVICVM